MLVSLSFSLAIVFALSSSVGFAETASKAFQTHTGPSLSERPDIKNRKPVLIYYSGDVKSRFSSDYLNSLKQILSALEAPKEGLAFDDVFLNRIRNLITYNLELMRLSSEAELNTLRKYACLAEPYTEAPLMIFSNSAGTAFSAGLEGTPNRFDVYSSYEYCDRGFYQRNPGFKGSARVAWNPGELLDIAKDELWSVQPTNHPTVFGKILEAVRTKYPQDKYRYHLLFRGQGDQEHFLRGHYLFDTSNLNREKLRQAFLDRKNEFVPADVKPEKFVIRPELATLVDEILASVLPRTKGVRGIEKRELMEVLASAGGGDPTKGMYFSSVIFASTWGQVELAEGLKNFASAEDYRGLEVDNIGHLRHFGSTSINRIPFEKLFDHFGLKSLPIGEKDFDKRWEALFNELAKGEKK